MPSTRRTTIVRSKRGAAPIKTTATKRAAKAGTATKVKSMAKATTRKAKKATTAGVATKAKVTKVRSKDKQVK